MTDELVERLRERCILAGFSKKLVHEATDHIDALTAERDRLREALEDIADHDTGATAGLAYTAKIALKGESHE